MYSRRESALVGILDFSDRQTSKDEVTLCCIFGHSKVKNCKLNMIRRILNYLRFFGIKTVLFFLFGRKCRNAILDTFLPDFVGKKGIEIGGPSDVFTANGIFPVYSSVESLDNCTFSSHTIWQKDLPAGKTFRFDNEKQPGFQYIVDAINLSEIQSEKYAFLLSSHAIEHFANPIKALNEWFRILKGGGLLLLVAPFKYTTFDNNRAFTTINHLIDDFKRNVEEDDATHVEEAITLHDFRFDPDTKGCEELGARLRDNYKTRCLHHHVFTPELVGELLKYAGFDILALETVFPHHIVAVGKKRG